MKAKATTSSRPRAWYLRTFRGHAVSYRVRRPILLPLGITMYATTWVLTAA